MSNDGRSAPLAAVGPVGWHLRITALVERMACSAPVAAPVIGIDLGPTRLVAAPLGGRELGEAVAARTDCADAATLVDQVVGLVERVRTDDLVAVGIGVPGIVDFETGTTFSPAAPASPFGNGSIALPLADVPLRAVLAQRLGVPVVVENDASVAALAEAHDEELSPDVRNLVLIIVSTNVSAGLVLDGRIYRGERGAAGELGHTMLGLDLAGAVPAPMGFPQPGSFEFAVAGHALDRLATVAGRVHPGSALARFRAEGKPVLGAAVIAAALEGDESAARMVRIWGQRIGIGVANAIHTFDPAEVVIGGDAASAGELLLDEVRRVARQYVAPGFGGLTTIRGVRHGARGTVLGAALIARVAAG